jgi:hypothetical protein
MDGILTSENAGSRAGQVVLLTRGSPAQTATRPCERWSILASQELDEPGLVDLLAASLAQQPGVASVQRRQSAGHRTCGPGSLGAFERGDGLVWEA